MGDDLNIELTPGGPPQTPPVPAPALPEDPKLKELLANLSKRISTLDSQYLEGNVKADAQKADIRKLADLIMSDTSMGFDDFKKKVVAENIPNKLETNTALGFMGMLNLFVPDICGDLSELLGLKREADKVHGPEKT